MKKITLFLLAFAALSAHAQLQHPVKWSYGRKKTAAGAYTLIFKAELRPGWHIYAQQQPKSAVAQPTVFRFTPAPGLRLLGPVRESGRLEHYHNAATGISARQYSGSVVFSQRVSVKGAGAIAGTITYQACTDKMCLAAEDVDFKVRLNPEP